MKIQNSEFRIQNPSTGGRRSAISDSQLSTVFFQPSASSLQPRAAFTLVEMLVVIFIMMILMVMTVTAVNFGMDSERIRSGARQLQSFLEGARDRAIYAKEARGVRFLVDQTDNRVVSSMVYVGPAAYENPGKVFLQRNGNDPTDPITRVAWKSDEHLPGGGFTVSEWYLLKQKGLLTDGTRIRIPRDGLWYTVTTANMNHSDPRGPDGEAGAANVDDDNDGVTDEDDELGWFGTDDPVLLLTVQFLQHDIVQHAGLTYELDLPPVVMPNQEPTLLARSIVVDLDRSRIPSMWWLSGSNEYTSRMDILFSPRGTVIGSPASMGTVHFALTEQIDAEFNMPLAAMAWSPSTSYVAGNWVSPTSPNGFFYRCKADGGSASAEPNWATSTGASVTDGGVVWEAYEKHDALIVSLHTQTGNVGSYPVYQDFSGTTDPFRFAETGEVASQ